MNPAHSKLPSFGPNLPTKTQNICKVLKWSKDFQGETKMIWNNPCFGQGEIFEKSRLHHFDKSYPSMIWAPPVFLTKKNICLFDELEGKLRSWVREIDAFMWMKNLLNHPK